MGLKKWLTDKVIDENIVESRINEGIKKRIKEDKRLFINATDGFRRLTDKDEKDLLPLAHEKHQKIAYYLGMRNPLARRILEYHKVFIAGGDIKVKANDPKVQDIIDLHWEKNKWNKKKGNKVKELGMYGEQCYTVFVNKASGLVKLGYIDPINIKEVKLNPNNPEERISVKLNSSVDSKDREIKIIDDLDSLPTDKPVKDGEYCFFFAVNTVSNAQRGYSDLLTIEDWLDAYDQVVFDFVERSKLLQSFIWDISISGASDTEIQARKEALEDHTPKAGSFVVHSEDEVWTQVTPDLRSRENIEEARHIKNLLLGGQALPEFWFAEGEKTTRATALAQGTPTLKALEDRQGFFKTMISDILKFQIFQSRIAKKTELQDVKDFGFTIIMPELEIKNYESLTKSLQALTMSLVLGLDNGLISQESASKIYLMFISKFGYEADTDIELKNLKTSAMNDYERLQKTFAEIKKIREKLKK